MVTTLPSLLGWQPGGQHRRLWGGLPRPGATGAAAGRSAVGGGAAAAACYSTLSDTISITPAIEAQLGRIQQRHADLTTQLSGEAMNA